MLVLRARHFTKNKRIMVTPERVRSWISRQLHGSASGPVANNSSRESALFDATWYVFKYPDIKSEADAFNHYMLHGWSERRWPHALFDPDFYLDQLPANVRTGANALVHYLTTSPEHSPHPLIDPTWYRKRYMDATNEDERVLEHLGRQVVPVNPNAWFDAGWYLDQHPDIAKLGWSPAAHYTHFGWKARSRPHEAFNSEWYAQTYLADLDVDPLAHYLTVGLENDYRVIEDFEGEVYLGLNPDVRAAGVPPSQHYFEAGFAEERKYKLAADKYIYTDFALLKRAIHDAGANYEGNSLSLRLALRRADEAHPYDVHYQGSRSTVDASDTVIDMAPQVLSLTNSYAVGGTRYVIDRDGYLLNLEESRYFDDANTGVKWGQASRSPDHQMLLQVKTRAAQFIDSGINLMHEHSENYFHFIAETLPRMMLAEEAGLPLDVPFVFERGLHANLVELIHASNAEQRPIVWFDPSVIVYFGTMYYPLDVSRIPNAYGGGAAAQETAVDVARVKRAVDRCKALATMPQMKQLGVYVSRRGKQRNIVNEEKLEEALLREGLGIAQVESLSIVEQISLFNSSTLFVSPTGAQLTNIVWCGPGTSLNYLVADHPHMQLHLWGLLGKVSGTTVVWTQGPRANRITGEYSVHDDFYINEKQVVDWVKKQSIDRKDDDAVA